MKIRNYRLCLNRYFKMRWFRRCAVCRVRQIFFLDTKNTMLFVATCVLAALALASGAKDADKITSLPGFVGTLPSTHYSGCTNLFCYFYFIFKYRVFIIN